MRSLVIAPRADQSEKVSEEGTTVAVVEKPSAKTRWIGYFHELDVIGLVLLIAGAGMILITISTANGNGSKWSDGQFFPLLLSDRSR